MKDPIALKVIDRFAGLFNRVGVEYATMRLILKVKLTLDQRRVPTIMNTRSKGNVKKDTNFFLRSLWMYGLMGLILIPFVVMGHHYLYQMSIAFSIFMFIIMTTMISDFSSVLLDVKDKSILNTKPVSPTTINVAKTLHVSIYLFFVTFTTTAIPLIVSLVVQGISFFLLFIVGIMLADLLVLFFTALIYFFILKVFDGERLKDMINYVQIGLTIAIVIGYQVVPRSFEFIDLNLSVDPKWWQIFLPPFWYGGAFEFLLNERHSLIIILFALLALICPVLSILAYVKLIPAFEKSLQKLSNHSEKYRKDHRKLTLLLTRLFCRDQTEKIFFRFASQMMKNERELKLKIYPSLGMSIILPFVVLFSFFSNTHWSLSELRTSHGYLTSYFSLTVIPSIVIMLKYSSKYKGAFIYVVTPIRDKSPIFKGTLKAFLARLFIPIYLVLSILFTILFGARILPDLIALLLAAFLYMVICFKVLGEGALPFSEPISEIQQGRGILVTLLLAIAVVFAGIDWGVSTLLYGIYGYIVLLIIANLILWKKMFKLTW